MAEFDSMGVLQPTARPEHGRSVRCRFCGGVYDLEAVKVTHRYADCSMFQTPCCDRQADDRAFVSAPAFRRLGRAEP